MVQSREVTIIDDKNGLRSEKLDGKEEIILQSLKFNDGVTVHLNLNTENST